MPTRNTSFMLLAVAFAVTAGIKVGALAQQYGRTRQTSVAGLVFAVCMAFLAVYMWKASGRARPQ